MGGQRSMDTNKQVIISIGREYGSAGHEIAAILAEKLQMPLYDHNLLDEIAREKNVLPDKLVKYDEYPRNRIFYRSVNGFSNSPEENVAHMQFEFLKDKAAKGESFVVVGRCSEEILKEYPGLITFFILGDMDKKIERIQKVRNMSESEAKSRIYAHDKKRKAYHNYYCSGKWGDSRNYDFSINSSRLGVEETVEIILQYIYKRIEQMD